MTGGWDRRRVRRVWRGRLFAVSLLSVIALLWGVQVWQSRQAALADAETLTASLARSLEFQALGSMRGIVALMDEMADTVDPARGLDQQRQDRYLARLDALPEVRNVLVVDDRGIIRGAPLARPGEILSAAAATVGDRDYFLKLRESLPHRPLMIAAPRVSRISGKPVIPVARAMVNRDGTFAGAVLVGIDPGIFRDQIGSVSVEPEGGAALIHADGTFLARVPGHDDYLGRSVASSPLFTEHLARAPSGVAHFISVADGNDKIVAFRKVTPYPLVVTVGITKRTALASWRTRAGQEGLALAVLAAALFTLATLYDRREGTNRHLVEELAASHNELERQVDERTAALATSNAELERFAYIASHDLKEPLRSISCFMQLLKRHYAERLDAEAHEYIDFAVAASQHSSKQIDDLLAFSRAGRFKDPPERCDADTLVRAAAENLAAEIAESGASLTLGPLPVVWCQPSLLQSLFQNLIANAITYRSPERPALIAVEARSEADGMVRFVVRDNGIGIEPQYHSRIFRVFQRLHPIGSHAGTGIGLALCKKIVERHGGRIWLESQPGLGTSLFFTLKAGDGEA
jgi:signal transduction histidine kinase